MTPSIVLAVLFAAVLHAIWNSLAHAVSDRLVGFALIGLVDAVGGAALAAAGGLPPAGAWPFIVASALTHPRARTSHNMTNLLIELDGDVATAESYCVTFARIKADGEYYHSFTAARMIDRLERRDGDPRTWGIAHRQLVWDWNHDAPEAETWMRGLLAPDLSVLRLSGKFPADPVYAPR